MPSCIGGNIWQREKYYVIRVAYTITVQFMNHASLCYNQQQAQFFVHVYMEAERHMEYVTSIERFAIQKGREEGRETAIRLLLRLLTHRFGETSAPLQERL